MMKDENLQPLPEEEDSVISAEEASLNEYTENDVQSLDWRTHLRERPGMYIGKLGDGSAFDDGIYVLLKEVADNSIDEYMMGFGKKIEINVTDSEVSVRDYGRGIPLGAVRDVSSKINTGAKFRDSQAFKKSVGLNGVGIKAVNALSEYFEISSVRDGQKKTVRYSRGEVVDDCGIEPTDEPNGTTVSFKPDSEIFPDYRFRMEFVEPLVKNYAYLNTGLSVVCNGQRYVSRNGLLDLLQNNMTDEPLYPIIHLKGTDIEVAITHINRYGEEYYSFVNGQHTVLGGTHLAAFKEAVSRTIKEYSKNSSFEYSDIRSGIVAAISIKVEEPNFESQTKTKLGSREIRPGGPTVAKFVSDFITTELDNFLHRNLDTANAIIKKVQANEKERKSMAGVTKKAREQAKKTSVYNKKLYDCRYHLSDTRGDEEKKIASSIFLTEGDSAAGSITKIRDVETQAVFSLRGKPENSFGKTKKLVYENEELNLLQAALNIEDGLDGLRYNKVIIATDADVDGMHIRLLLLTFFLQFFPDLVKAGHVYILQTPLFRVRNKKTAKRSGRKDTGTEEVYYCYSDEERIAAIEKLGDKAEITRFKGLGEISPEEFEGFIGKDIRLDPVTIHKEDCVAELLRFYMGANTIERQNFIIENLVVEDDTEIS